MGVARIFTVIFITILMLSLLVVTLILFTTLVLKGEFVSGMRLFGVVIVLRDLWGFLHS